MTPIEHNGKNLLNLIGKKPQMSEHKSLRRLEGREHILRVITLSLRPRRASQWAGLLASLNTWVRVKLPWAFWCHISQTRDCWVPLYCQGSSTVWIVHYESDSIVAFSKPFSIAQSIANLIPHISAIRGKQKVMLRTWQHKTIPLLSRPRKPIAAFFLIKSTWHPRWI